MAIRIRRREFIDALARAAAAWPLPASGQSAVPVIGFLNGASQDGHAPIVTAFLQDLKEAIGSIGHRRCG